MVSEETERSSDRLRAHSKAKGPSEYVHSSSLVSGQCEQEDTEERAWGKTVCHHSLEEQQDPNLSQETGDKVQGRLTEQTEAHE